MSKKEEIKKKKVSSTRAKKLKQKYTAAQIQKAEQILSVLEQTAVTKKKKNKPKTDTTAVVEKKKTQ
jgi:hypothetical protein